jgi:hypothetical protein
VDSISTFLSRTGLRGDRELADSGWAADVSGDDTKENTIPALNGEGILDIRLTGIPEAARWEQIALAGGLLILEALSSYVFTNPSSDRGDCLFDAGRCRE